MPATPPTAEDAAAPDDRPTIGDDRDDPRLAAWDRHIALPLAMAAVLPIVLTPTSESGPVVIAVNLVAWGVFVADFAYRVRFTPGYLRSWVGWFDLAIVVLTAPWFLIPSATNGRFVQVARLARLARVVRVGAGLRRLVDRLNKVVFIALGVMVTASWVVYQAEEGTGGFDSFADALWWGMVTLTTVGYGDLVPETDTGRWAAVLLMVTGIATLGALAGSLAAFFKVDDPEEEAADAAAAATIARLEAKVDALQAGIDELRTQLGAPATPGGDAAAGATDD